jgi:integrase
LKLSEITADVIEDFKERRLAQEVRTATVNRDLAVLHRMMKLAERKMLISESPFRDVEFLEERKRRRRPHILTFEEEDRLLAAATPHVRALSVLILETGMRSRREALSLLWNDIDFVNDLIRVRESKTRAGERSIPISDRCKIELLRWRSLLGPEFSSYVFPSLHDPSKPLKDLPRSWAKALRDAGLPYFWQYDLRATLATRLTHAGVSPLFVAQILGRHSSTSILSTYAVPSTNTEGTQFTSWKIYEATTYRGRNDLRSCQTDLSNGEPLQFHDNLAFGRVCEGSFH